MVAKTARLLPPAGQTTQQQPAFRRCPPLFLAESVRYQKRAWGGPSATASAHRPVVGRRNQIAGAKLSGLGVGLGGCEVFMSKGTQKPKALKSLRELFDNNDLSKEEKAQYESWIGEFDRRVGGLESSNIECQIFRSAEQEWVKPHARHSRRF